MHVSNLQNTRNSEMKKFLSALLAIFAVLLLVSCSEKDELTGKIYYEVTNIEKCPENAENRLIWLLLSDNNGKIAYAGSSSNSRNIVDIDDIKLGTYLRQTFIIDRGYGIICQTSPTSIEFTANKKVVILEENISFPTQDELAYYFYVTLDEDENVTLKSHSYLTAADADKMAQVLTSNSDIYSNNTLDINKLAEAVNGKSIDRNINIYVDNLRLNIPTSLGIKTIQMNENVTKLFSSAFEGLTTLETIDLSNVTSIGSAAFRGCTSLESVTLNKAINNINSFTFKGCAELTTISFEKIDYVGAGAFEGCSKLTANTINFKRIDDKAFKDCTSLNASTIT